MNTIIITIATIYIINDYNNKYYDYNLVIKYRPDIVANEIPRLNNFLNSQSNYTNQPQLECIKSECSENLILFKNILNLIKQKEKKNQISNYQLKETKL